MRAALLLLLIGGMIATPVAAFAQGGDEQLTERYRRLGERNQQRVERRLERQERRDAGRESAAGHDHAPAGLGHQAPQGGNEHRAVHRDYVREHRQLHRDDPSPGEHRRFHREVRRDHREVHRDTHGGLHGDLREEHRDLHRSEPTRREHRQFHRQADREHNRYHRQWDTGWRNDRRYDWQRYRYSNRNLFGSGSYYAPYRGERYRRLSIGFAINPGFYSQRYWISDPWSYRLPQPYPGTRWIRYYDDVLLVDLYTGEVLDVIHNFFW